jgi:hypothetical protein
MPAFAWLATLALPPTSHPPGACRQVLFAMSWDTLEPTEYGLVANGFTGAVSERPAQPTKLLS